MPEEIHGWYCADCCPACHPELLRPPRLVQFESNSTCRIADGSLTCVGHTTAILMRSSEYEGFFLALLDNGTVACEPTRGNLRLKPRAG